MTDFLDGELGDFDWGPSSRRHHLSRRVRLDTCGPLVHALLVGIGSLLLTLGIATAWASYTSSADAAPAPAGAIAPADHPDAPAPATDVGGDTHARLGDDP